jgi:hypothetical protein
MVVLMSTVLPSLLVCRANLLLRQLFALNHAQESLGPAFAEGFYTRLPLAGLRAFAAIYAGWGFLRPFYRTEAFRHSA